jgi:hypothetical protein
VLGAFRANALPNLPTGVIVGNGTSAVSASSNLLIASDGTITLYQPNNVPTDKNNYNIGGGNIALNTGGFNTGFGEDNLSQVGFVGSNNSAFGYKSSFAMTTGDNNTSVGFSSLLSETVGDDNTAIGHYSLFYSNNGNYNTAIGSYSLYTNSLGGQNVALGYEALRNNTTSSHNTALGYRALKLSTGDHNLGVGYNSGNLITSGTSNVVLGSFSGYRAASPTVLEYDIRTTSNNIVISDGAGTVYQSFDNSGAVRLHTYGINDHTGTLAKTLGVDANGNVIEVEATTGTVTSVALSVPTGLTVTGSPITTSGTIAIANTSGYSIPTDAKQTQWDTAYTNRITTATSPLSITTNTISLNTVPVSNGGTGATTLTGILLGNGTSAISAVTDGTTSGQVLSTDGNGVYSFITAATGVPDWVTFVTATTNQMVLKSGGDGTGTSKAFLKFASYNGTVNTFITHNGFDGTFAINGYYSSMYLGSQISFSQAGTRRLRVEANGDLTHWGNVLRLNAEQLFDANPLYTLKFQGRITGPSGGSYTDEEFANIKGGKENATENDKAGFLSFETGIANGTLTERLRISSAGAATFSGNLTVNGAATFTAAITPLIVKGTNASTMYTEYYYNTSTLAGYIGNGSGLLTGANASDFITRSEADYVVATGGNNERMRISSVGVTTLTNSSTSNTLVLNGTSGYSYLRTQQSGVDKWAIGNMTSVSDNLEFYNGTTKLTITSGGVVSIPNGIVFNNNSVTGDKTNVTLNAYEEGTWTPTVLSANGNESTEGTYTRIGNIVRVGGLIVFNTQTDTTQFTIQSFPFQVGSTNEGTRGGVSVAYSTSSTYYTIIMDNGYFQARAFGQGATGNPTLAGLSGTRVYFGGTYQV